MVPVRGEQPEAERLPFPWVCALILGGSAVVHALKVFVVARWPPRTAAEALALTLKFGALWTPSVREGEWWRLVSYAFAHGGLTHLAFNMFATTALGIPLERRIGTLRFAQISLAACLGSAAVVILAPRGAPLPTVGASGVIFGWAGALLLLLTRAARAQLIQMLVINAAISMLPGVSWQGHLGGFLFGLAAGFLLRADPPRFSTRTPYLVALATGLAIWGAYRH